MSSHEQHTPKPDPLIDEIRRIRREISESHGNDVRRLGAHLQEIQRKFASRVVHVPVDRSRTKGA